MKEYSDWAHKSQGPTWTAHSPLPKRKPPVAVGIKEQGDAKRHTYQKNEEHKEHKCSEINWSQNSISFFNLCEVEVSQNDAELSKS